MRRHAFTMIELIIAVALSAVICATAAVALRVCASTFTATQRLTVTSRMMRAGVLAALDDLDTWKVCDDPDDPARQPLRAAGNAFSPVAFSRPTFTPEAPQDQPQTWWRGLGAVNDDKRFGDYAMFSRLGHPDPERCWYPDLMAGLSAQIGHYGMIDYAPANLMFSMYDASGQVPIQY